MATTIRPPFFLPSFPGQQLVADVSDEEVGLAGLGVVRDGHVLHVLHVQVGDRHLPWKRKAPTLFEESKSGLTGIESQK